MDPISTRIDGWLRDRIAEFGRQHREGPSEALRRVAEEWWAMTRFPAIEFRDGVSGRRAGLRGGPDLWEVIMVWKEYDPDRDALSEHFAGYVEPEALELALAYYEHFPEEIDDRLEENRRIAARLEAGSGPK